MVLSNGPPPVSPVTSRSRSCSEAGSRAAASKGASEQVEIDLGSWSPPRLVGTLPLSFSKRSLERGVRKGVHSAALLSGLGVCFERSSVDESVASQERRSPSAEANSRWQKYIALLVHFNARMAYFTSLATSLLTAGAACLRILSPNIVVHLPCGSEVPEVTMTVTPFFVGAATFVLIIFFGQSVRRLFEYLGVLSPRYLFLDSLCIDQSDPELKERGIQNLGSFLSSSDRLVLLWSRDILTRLWCIFEIAVFEHLRQQGHNGEVVILPLSTSMHQALLFSCVIFSWTIEALLLMFRGSLQVRWALLALYLPPTIPLALVSARCFFQSMASFEELEDQCKNFSLRNTQCTVDADRERIFLSVTLWFGGDTTDEDLAVERLNSFVRNEVRARGQEQIGAPSDMRYATALFLSAPSLWFNTIGCLASFRLPPDTYTAIMANRLMGDLIVCPLAFALATKFMSLCHCAWRSERRVVALLLVVPTCAGAWSVYVFVWMSNAFVLRLENHVAVGACYTGFLLSVLLFFNRNRRCTLCAPCHRSTNA